jgi:hypothetical protein
LILENVRTDLTVNCVCSYADADTTQPTASDEGVVAMLDFVDDALHGAALTVSATLRMISTRCVATFVTRERLGALLLWYVAIHYYSRQRPVFRTSASINPAGQLDADITPIRRARRSDPTRAGRNRVVLLLLLFL